MNITIKVIPNTEHRPGITGADWFWDENKDLQVRVSKMSSVPREICLALHETVEAILCRFNGVSQQSVDEFDAKYERENPDRKIMAGDQPDAPYRREHSLAEAIERVMAAELHVEWWDYNQEVERL